MRIAIFSDVFLEVPGGIPSSINALRTELMGLGHKVTVFAPGWSKVNDSNIVVVPTMKLKINGAPVAKSPEVVMQWLLENQGDLAQFDLYHVHYEGGCSIAGMKLARKFNIPLVQTMHGREDMAVAVNVPHPFKTLVGVILSKLHARYIPDKVVIKRDDYLADSLAKAKMWTMMVNHANFADEVVTPSQHFADKLKHYGVKKPITAVSNGISDASVKAFGRVTPRRLAPGEPLTMIWNSRVSHEKRIMPFLLALSLMQQPFKLLVCGDGNALALAKRFVRRHGLTDKVQFLGVIPHDEMLGKLRNVQLSVMMSFGFDTQGMTLLEAEAVGLPVLFVDPDMAEVVPKGGAVNVAEMTKNNGKTPPAAEQVAHALDDLASHPKRIEKMSEAMIKDRERILQSRQVEKMLEVYERAIKITAAE